MGLRPLFFHLRPTSVIYGNGTSRSFSYDPASRLATLGITMPAAPASNLSQGFTYNPASQIASVTRSNDAYAWNGLTNRNDSASINGLNQMTAQGALPLTHDTRGNITGVGASAYSYTSDNMLKTGPGGTNLAYDPMSRLQSVTQGSSITRFGYDGSDLVTERDGSNTLTRRYVHGPGTDAPIVWYEGAGTTDRRFLHADERGSIVAVTNGTGGVVGTNHYDDYGVPAATNIGRFQYTGQTWMSELGLYNYKARFYDPKLGRFMQTDPIGYGSGMNLYAYIGGDPVNMVDPSGMKAAWICDANGKCGWGDDGKGDDGPPIIVNGRGGLHSWEVSGVGGLGYAPEGSRGGGGSASDPVTPTCKRLAAEASKSNATIPNYIKSNPLAYNDTDRLVFHKNWFNNVAAQNEAVASAISIGGTASSGGTLIQAAAKRSAAGGLLGAAVLFGGDLSSRFLSSRAKDQRNVANAINARINLLQAQNDGTCSK